VVAPRSRGRMQLLTSRQPSVMNCGPCTLARGSLAGWGLVHMHAASLYVLLVVVDVLHARELVTFLLDDIAVSAYTSMPYVVRELAGRHITFSGFLVPPGVTGNSRPWYQTCMVCLDCVRSNAHHLWSHCQLALVLLIVLLQIASSMLQISAPHGAQQACMHIAAALCPVICSVGKLDGSTSCPSLYYLISLGFI